MKMDDKQKKRMIIGGSGILCLILVFLIAGQFKGEPVAAVQETSQVLQTTIAKPSVESSEAAKETVKAEIIPQTTEAPVKDQTDETIQEIQPEVTKPAEPKDEERHDPAKKPNGEPVKPTEPVIVETEPAPPTEAPTATEPQPVVPPTEPQSVVPPTEMPTEAPTEGPTEGSTSAPQEGQIYVPGFGWVTPSGSVGRDVDSDGDINKQVGIMD